MRRPALALSLAAALAACQSAPDPGAARPGPRPPPQALPPLELLTRMTLPANVSTVRDAAAHLLEPTGYRLALDCAGCPPEAAEIGRKPVSPLGLRPELTTVKRALVLVAGSRTRLVVDDQARVVSYGYLDEGAAR